MWPPWGVGRLSRKLLSIDEIFEPEGDKLCPGNIIILCENDIDINPVLKIDITPKLSWNSMDLWCGGGSSPQPPQFDDNFDLDGDKVCSSELLSSSDPMLTQIMK